MSDTDDTPTTQESLLIDPNRTLALIGGGLTRPEPTWREFLPDAASWQKTSLLLTIPLVLLGAVGAYLVSFLGSDNLLFVSMRPTLVSTVMTIVTSLVAAVVVAFVFSALAGVCGGKNHFALGLAATSFAFIPGYISQAIVWLPWLGGLIAFGLFIYAMVLLWKIIPIYLEVPEAKRVMHYVFSLIGSIVAVIVLSITLGGFLLPSLGASSMPSFSDSKRSSQNTGILSGFARQGELLAAAEEDQYTPPANGRLSRSQVREFIRVMERASELQSEKSAELKDLVAKADRKEDMSIRDLGRMMEGAAEVTGLPTTEIEVVKTAGRNWAEHQWVREALRTARIQKDINSDIAHNYAIYQSYEGDLARYVGR